MIQVRRSEERGFADHGWLKSRHTFSFGDYRDDRLMGFGALRVINEDRIDGGTGFGTHSHRNMEILSYVVEGGLRHQDSMGNSTIIRPGEVQRLSAGTGIQHSEHNEFSDRPTHFLQIWIIPESNEIKPGYGQKSFTGDFACSDLILVASKLGRDGSITLNQDVDMYVGRAQDDGEKVMKTYLHRYLWIQVIEGEIDIAGEAKLRAGDGAAVKEVEALKLLWQKGAHFVYFDLPR